MDSKPNGTVTFLFTDIEGSTKLAQQFPQSYHSILDQHHAILHEVIESNNGFVFKIVGDSFCASFHNSIDAINASCETQKKLLEHDWGECQIKVRMGIHTGEAEYMNGDYIGYLTLSRSSRIMSVANGGQVLLTQEVYDAAANNLPEGVTLRDLGERKLKDIIFPEHIYQIVLKGLLSEFPPLKSLDIRPNNLPLQITKFVGREKEIAELKKLLSESRKITIVGTGGTGKTRLAIRVASDIVDDFANGVWLVELATLTDPELITNEISLILNLKEEGNRDLLETLKEYLRDKELLLIFDNSEHLLEKCARITVALLQACPKLKIISTSRESLNISGETVYRVPPLSVPDPSKKHTVKSVEEYESTKLFIDRALLTKPNFMITDDNVNALVELCRKLDGIPFAIELAATRVNVLPIEKILDRLTDRFKLLTRGSSTTLPRHQTLRTLIDWSYELLNSQEKLLLQRLSIFLGGCTLEAVEEICADETISDFEILDLLTSLVDKSLIIVNEVDENIRYNMLETIKQYGLEKLTDKQSEYKRHFDYYLKLSNSEDMKSKGIEQKNWIKIMQSELDNLRLAIQWSLENEPENAFRIIIFAGNFWLIKSYFNEGYQTCLKALEIKTVTDKGLRAKVLLTAAEMCYGLGHFSELESFIEEGLTLFREISEKKGIAECLIQLGNMKYTNLEINKSRDYFEDALKISNEINSKELRAVTLRNLSFLENHQGDTELSLKHREEALRIFREIKDTYNTANVLASLGIFELLRKNFDRANIFSEESLSIARENGDQYFISINLINLGRIHSEKKDFLKAEYFLDESLKILKEYGYTINLHPALIYLGGILRDKGDYVKSIQTYKDFLSGSSKPGGNFFLRRAFIGMGECYFMIEAFMLAVEFFSFTEKVIENSQLELTHAESTILEKYKTILREKLGDEKFDQYWNDAKKLSADEAVSYSLKEENVQLSQ